MYRTSNGICFTDFLFFIPKDAGGYYNGFVKEDILFIGSGSKDPNTGDVLKYNWDFGDGNTEVIQNPSHQYSKAGNYTITLTVYDQDGKTDIDSTYAFIKSKSTEDSPGYEIILVFIAMLVVSIALRKKKK